MKNTRFLLNVYKIISVQSNKIQPSQINQLSQTIQTIQPVETNQPVEPIQPVELIQPVEPIQSTSSDPTYKPICCQSGCTNCVDINTNIDNINNVLS